MLNKITLPVEQMSTTCFLLCLEDEDNYRWLRTQQYDNTTFIIIDGESYGDPEYKGYSMKFDSVADGVNWIKSKINAGWKLTFVSEAEPVGEETLARIHLRVMRDLKQI
jgi:hypothetical protein